MTTTVERFEAGAGRLYRLPLDLFPGLTGYAHLLVTPDVRMLIDVGSGFGDSNAQLEAGLLQVNEAYGEAVAWDRLTHVLITHGHIDHFGGLSYVRQRTSAPVGIHEFDRPLLTEYETRLELMGGRLRRFLEVAGVEPEERQALMDLYLFNKLLFTAQEVDFVIAASESQLGPLQTLHVPGHCPGQIVLRLGDVLLTSDHVLPDITPHMAPGSLAEHTGLAEYLRSLDLLAGWADGARLALGGHGPPMTDVLGRIAEIRRHHEARLEAVLDALRPPAMMVNVADRLFPTAGGYHRLLALEEVGAHMEYLGAQGRVRSAGGEMDRPAVFQRSDAAQGGSAARLRAARR